MLENVNPTERYKDLLEAHYGIQVTGIREAPRGFAGETYFVDTAGGPSLFFKIMRDPRRYAFFLHGLQVTEALKAEGIGFIPSLIPTADGERNIMTGGAPAALYERLDARHTWDFDREDAFRKLAAIYKASERFPERGRFWQESFGDGFIARFERQWRDFAENQPATEEAVRIRQLIEPHGEFLSRCPEIAARATAASRKAGTAFRLTHSDFTNNVLVADNDEQFLIDFDEAMFGPLERDGFMCVAPEDDISGLWHEVMEEAFPGYRSNPAFIRYYLYERFMVDLATFMHESVHHPDPRHRAKLVDSTRDYLVEWMLPILQRWENRE